MSNSKVVYEGWMVRYGRRKIGRSFIHMRYFVLESRLLAYYKRKPQDNVVRINSEVELDYRMHALCCMLYNFAFVFVVSSVIRLLRLINRSEF